jgi:hypothetical protein
MHTWFLEVFRARVVLHVPKKSDEAALNSVGYKELFYVTHTV